MILVHQSKSIAFWKILKTGAILTYNFIYTLNATQIQYNSNYKGQLINHENVRNFKIEVERSQDKIVELFWMTR